jgi:CRISPR system Cascade subunit CasB
MTKPRDQLYTAVAGRVGELQRKATDESVHHGDTAGRLARLRHAINAEPGNDPAVWADTIEVLPTNLWGGAEPSPYERAAHTALTLFALHVQSASGPVHKSGISLGAAARRLAHARAVEPGTPDPAVFRRFQKLATATSSAELRHHLRSMITLMRGEGVQLDYGLLAVHLVELDSSRSADKVRLRWGRDYHRIPADTEDSADTTHAASQTV